MRVGLRTLVVLGLAAAGGWAASTSKSMLPFDMNVFSGSPESENLMLDPRIRDWVLMPILFVMLLQGIIREYISAILKDPPKTERAKLKSMAQLQRSKVLRQFGHNIPQDAFRMRRTYLTSKAFKAPEETKDSKDGMPKLPQQDPMAMMGMMKQNMAMVVPSMILFGWTSYFFSGFVLMKIPFGLAGKFKPMLQSGVNLGTLDVSYVSSLSWYIMLFMGFRGLYSVILGANNAADQTKLMKQRVQGPAGPMQNFDKMNAAEKTELEIHNHDWVTPSAEERFKALQTRY